MSKPSKPSKKTIFTKNKKALHDFEVLEKLEVGMVLLGKEVKAIRNGAFSLVGSYVKISEKSVDSIGSNIGLVSDGFNPNRDRKLLLNKGEIRKMSKKIYASGLTLVILDVYQTDNKPIKGTLALVKGKKKHDKREALKEKQINIQVKRDLKRI